MSHVHASPMTHSGRRHIPYGCAMNGATAGESFGNLIARGRKAKHWSQEDLERASGVSRSTLSRWEGGHAGRPEPAHVRKVCAALGLDPRRAAVALGYLTEEEVDTSGRALPNEIEEILTILEDPALPVDERQNWISYLKYLHAKAHHRAV